MKRRLLKNALANLTRGGIGALVAISLPPVLVRHMEASTYAVWVLILQVVAYVGYLDFGLQTAVGRYIAFANETKDPHRRDGIYSTAFVGLALASLLGMVLLIVAVGASPFIFPGIPSHLLPAMRSAILIVGISVALGLPASAWNGVFVGLQRYEIAAVTSTAGKLLTALGLIVAAITRQSLVFMAAVVAFSNLFSYAVQFGMLKRIAVEIHFKKELISKGIIRELWGYCFSLTVWSFSMLLITGFDLILVGRFDFRAVIPYSVSATLITFLAGAQNAIFGVIMPHAAQLHARQNSEALGNLLVKATKLGVLVLLLTGLPLVVFARPIIRIWIGGQFAQTGGRVLVILVLANMLRLTGAPFASILIGTGQQRLVVVSPLMEGFSNLIFSIILGLKYGAVGVAGGTLIGAAAAVMANICYNLPRARNNIQCSPLRYFVEAMLWPSLCGLPVCLSLLATMELEPGNAFVLFALFASCCVCAILIFRTGFRDLRPRLSAAGADIDTG